MSRRSIVEEKNTNLTNRLILPMVGISYDKLPNNFFNSYLTPDNYIVIVITKEYPYLEEAYDWVQSSKYTYRCFEKYEDCGDEYNLYFKIPDKFIDDINLFLKGKYSKMSKNYKDTIRRICGYKTIKDSYHVTEYDIISATETKRKQLAEYLEVDVSLITEVLSSPNTEQLVFKNINDLVKEKVEK